MKTNNILKMSLLVLPFIVGCSNPTPTPEEKPDELSVIILAGQSNMEGNTWSSYVSTSYGFNEDEVAQIKAGYDDIKMNYRCFWNGNPSGGTTSYGQFKSVRLGQANTTAKFGPEIGIADYLTEHGHGEDVVLIKYAVGASVLAPAAGEWGSPSSGRSQNGKWYDATLTLVADSIVSLEETTGKKPVIKAMCWMQGESDAGNANYNSHYYDNLTNFVNDLRGEWEADSKEGGFTFIDAYISQYWTGYTTINSAKTRFAQDDGNAMCIDTIGEGLQYNTQPVGSVDYYHYDAYSMFKLGRLFGEMIEQAL